MTNEKLSRWRSECDREFLELVESGEIDRRMERVKSGHYFVLVPGGIIDGPAIEQDEFWAHAEMEDSSDRSQLDLINGQVQ